MTQISRVTTWSNGQILTAPALNGEFNQIDTFWNNHDSGSSSWTTVSTSGNLSVTGTSSLTGNASLLGTLTVTGSTILTGGIAGTFDGWISANETWSYSSSTDFTVPGDVTGKYQIGDKIKLTNTTVKYFYIKSLTFSNPNTTITLTGGTDYTLANTAITAPFYSKTYNPQGFPTWFNYTPSYSASGSMTYTSVTNRAAMFQIRGTSVQVIVAAVGTTGGTASDTLQVSIPFSPDVATIKYRNGASVIDAGDLIAGSMFVDTNVFGFKQYAAANYGLGANRAVYGQITYTFT